MSLGDNYPEKMAIVSHVEFVLLDGTRVGNQITLADGTVLPVSDPSLEVPRGNITGQSGLNKFGRSTNVDNGVTTDIWDRANVANNQPIWIAPTAARIHTIQSNSANDVTGGTGANSVVVSYLLDWDTAGATETVTGNLNAGIAMTNAAVIIHRMEVIPQATSTSENVGTITATAADDGTITAQIQPAEGQTQMAIYGIPSIQSLYMSQFYASVLRANAATAFIDIRLLFNPSPDINTLLYLVKHTLGIQSTGGAPYAHPYRPYKKFAGPGIIKLEAVGSTNDLDVSGGFDGVLVNN